MSWSDVIYKFAPFREDVVQDMVQVVHDALGVTVINRFCQFCEVSCFWGAGHYGCHVVRVPARVVASQICEMPRNSPQIHRNSSSRSSKVIDLAFYNAII